MKLLFTALTCATLAITPLAHAQSVDVGSLPAASGQLDTSSLTSGSGVTGTGTEGSLTALTTQLTGASSGGSSQVSRTLTTNPLGTVDMVETEKYMGTWYQIAALPQPYTLFCSRNTTATYAIVSENLVSVKNKCTTVLGGQTIIDGQAVVKDLDTRASLRVTFPSVPFQDPNGPANYLVTYLAEDYSLAIVGDPARASGFVLSRTPSVSAETWSMIKDTVTQRGWNPCVFITTPQVDGRSDTTPLCQAVK